MKEIWKDIEGYEGLYQISNTGILKSIYFNKIKIKAAPLAKGYKNVMLYKDSKYKHFYIHRLVALMFLPNPENKLQVNHIDGNKLNNNVNNLEWCTQSENMKHAVKIGLLNAKEINKKRFGKPINKLSLNGDFIKKYDCIIDAAKFNKTMPQSISQCLRKISKTCAGFKWEYA